MAKMVQVEAMETMSLNGSSMKMIFDKIMAILLSSSGISEMC